MRKHYRLFWAVLALFMMTAFLSGKKPLENTETLWEAVTGSDEASVKALLIQRADLNSKTQAD